MCFEIQKVGARSLNPAVACTGSNFQKERDCVCFTSPSHRFWVTHVQSRLRALFTNSKKSMRPKLCVSKSEEKRTNTSPSATPRPKFLRAFCCAVRATLPFQPRKSARHRFSWRLPNYKNIKFLHPNENQERNLKFECELLFEIAKSTLAPRPALLSWLRFQKVSKFVKTSQVQGFKIWNKSCTLFCHTI